ncbi:MAG: hypothetical protein ACO3DT_10715 [Gammaproteobacteria bacterium]
MLRVARYCHASRCRDIDRLAATGCRKLGPGPDYFDFFPTSFLIFATCCFSQRWPAASIILAFFSPSFNSACSRFSAALRFSFNKSISALAAALASFNSSLAALRALRSVALVDFKSARSCLIKAWRELAAILRLGAAFFSLTAVFLVAALLTGGVFALVVDFFLMEAAFFCGAAFFTAGFFTAALFLTAAFFVVGISGP